MVSPCLVRPCIVVWAKLIISIPFVFILRSGRKLSVRACEMFALSSSRAMNMMHAQTMMYRSILRTRRNSSLQVHLNNGSNLCVFSLYPGSATHGYCAWPLGILTSLPLGDTSQPRADHRRHWAVAGMSLSYAHRTCRTYLGSNTIFVNLRRRLEQRSFLLHRHPQRGDVAVQRGGRGRRRPLTANISAKNRCHGASTSDCVQRVLAIVFVSHLQSGVSSSMQLWRIQRRSGQLFKSAMVPGGYKWVAPGLYPFYEGCKDSATKLCA